MSSNTDDVTLSQERLIGRVKWFNNKAGYGFITVTDGVRSGSDVFVHHSSVNVENQQYKYLVQGEYVEFSLIKTTSGSHEWQASQVSGINSGKLMCETRREFKIARNTYKSDKTDSSTEPAVEVTPQVEETKPPRQPRVPRDAAAQPKQRAPRARGEGPREGDKKEWTLVAKKTESKVRGKSTRQ
jgi:CspA family cold shock protein